MTNYTDWQPIDTALENEIVLLCDEGDVNPGMLKEGVWYFWDGEMGVDENCVGNGKIATLNHYVNGYKPDYWAPLPKAWEPFYD